MNDKDFPQNELQRKIYDFWSVRGWSNATATLGNLDVHLHRDNPRYECLGIDYIYLEQFYKFAQDELIKNNHSLAYKKRETGKQSLDVGLNKIKGGKAKSFCLL